MCRRPVKVIESCVDTLISIIHAGSRVKGFVLESVPGFSGSIPPDEKGVRSQRDEHLERFVISGLAERRCSRRKRKCVVRQMDITLVDHVSPGRVLFGAFELDLRTGELRSAEAPDPNNRVLLREQVFQVLRMLLEREGKILTREEIKGRLWPNDTVVDFDRSINATIKALRRALGDSADNPRYIETLARSLSSVLR